MGDFSMACGASSISLINTDVVLIPLMPAKYESKEGKFQFNGAHIVTNNGAMSLFEPITLPIYGYLDSYGCLSSVEPSFNIEAIEKYFDLPIEEFADGIAIEGFDKEVKEKFPILKYTAGMYVHRDIYEFMSGDLAGEFSKKKSDTKDLGDKVSGYLKDAAKFLQKYTEVIPSIEEILYKPDSEKDENYYKNVFSMTNFLMGTGRYYCSVGTDATIHTTLNLYRDAILSGEIIEPMIKFKKFLWNMMACNRLLMPQYNGYQYGNHYANKQLHSKIVQVLGAKLKKDKKDSW